MRKLFYEDIKDLKAFPILNIGISTRENLMITFWNDDVFYNYDDNGEILGILSDHFYELSPDKREDEMMMLYGLLASCTSDGKLETSLPCEVCIKNLWQAVGEVINYGKLEWGGIGIIIKWSEKGGDVCEEFIGRIEEIYFGERTIF